MQYAYLGKSNLKFSKIILGTWQAGKSMWADIEDQQIIKAIQKAVDIGMTSIDTAAIYGDGYSERIIAQALKGVERNKYQIATKVFSDKLKHQQVLEECEKSLKNLQTDYIDLYQIHWPSGSFNSPIVPIEETMKTLIQLQNQGKIRHIGVSNFSKSQIQEAQAFGEILSNQPPYSLIWRAYDQETNLYCRHHNLAILAYSPLAQGILTGKFKKNHVFHTGDHRSANKLMQPQVFDWVAMVLDGLLPYAEKYHTSLGNIALNWLISQPETFAIVGARNPKQVEENAQACSFQLNIQELKEINELSKLVTQAMPQDEMMWTW